MKLAFWKKSGHTAGQVDFSRLPRHIAIILDGNGRWAKRRGLPRTAGHRVGAETFRTIATYCRDIGIEYLTVYAFSTANWKRPQEEVDTIMVLLKRYLLEAIETMERDNVRLRFMGDLAPLDQELRDLIEAHVAATGSPRGKKILAAFQSYIPCFKKVMPKDYDKMLRAIAQREEKGVSREQAEMDAFYAVSKG